MPSCSTTSIGTGPTGFDLRRRSQAVSRPIVLRLLSFFLMIALMASHGSLGAAVGHHEQGGHSHELALDVGHHGEVESEQVEASQTDPADEDFDKNSKSSLGHVHLTADGLPIGSVSRTGLIIAEIPAFPPGEAALRSAAIPPLLEPPAA